jgi:hypothetical protein
VSIHILHAYENETIVNIHARKMFPVIFERSIKNVMTGFIM